MTEEKILKLKQDIDSKKIEVSKLEGKKEQLLSELKKKWKCEDVKEANKKLVKMDADIENYDDRIIKGIEEIDEKYEKINKDNQ